MIMIYVYYDYVIKSAAKGWLKKERERRRIIVRFI